MGAQAIWSELLGDAGGWTLLSKWRVDAKHEGLHIDFKAGTFANKDVSADDRKNLARGMSAFGNTEGGLLVFGAETRRDPATKADRLKALTGVTPLDEYAERLRLHAKDSTTPRIPGVDVRAFEDPKRPGTGVVVVYVPLTDGLPYRAEGPDREVSGRYFIRTTTDTDQMSHQLLAALFGRIPPPRLRIGLARKNVRKVEVFVENTGRGAAEFPLVRVHVDRGADIDTLAFDVREPWRDRRGDVYLGGHGPPWHAAAGLLGDQRIYPGEVRLVGTFDFLRDDPTIRARIDCANAAPTLIDQRLALGSAISWLENTP